MPVLRPAGPRRESGPQPAQIGEPDRVRLVGFRTDAFFIGLDGAIEALVEDGVRLTVTRDGLQLGNLLTQALETPQTAEPGLERRRFGVALDIVFDPVPEDSFVRRRP